MHEPPTNPENFESFPLTRSEYIAAMVHFYRGELQRANSWRMRLDHSTNWAIIATLGLLTFTFGTREHPHLVLVFGMYMAFTFLALEARRFRFFDVWRARVRMIEENFFGPILRRDLISPTAHWGNLVAEDLLSPRFKISYAQALRARLVRNYIPLFLVLLVSWFVKVAIHPNAIGGDVELKNNLRIGPIPWIVPVLLVGILYAFLASLILFVAKVRAPEMEYWAHQREAEEVGDLDV